MNLLQRGPSAAPLLLCYHCGPSLVPAVPGWSVVSVVGVRYPTVTLADVDAARRLSGSQGPLVLVGWSAGCQAVRELLRSGVDVAAVMALDGAHASLPIGSWQLDVWREYAASGRVLVVTATQQTYVERLPPGQRYASTQRVADALMWGWSADAADEVPLYNLLRPGSYTHGAIHIEVHASLAVDGDAHTREVTEHGVRILREVIVPAVGVESVAPVVQAPEEQSLGLRALDLARAELARGVTETSPNRGERIEMYQRPCVRAGMKPGFAVGLEWCAAFVSWCVWQASTGDVYPRVARTWSPREDVRRGYDFPPIGYRCAVSELHDDAVATGTWRSGVTDSHPLPGDLLVMGRGGGDPTRGGQGHVEIVDEVVPEGLWCIGGNVGNAVKRTLRRWRVDAVKGWISLS